MSESEPNGASGRWWGRFGIPSGGGGFWSVGPFRLWIRRRAGEWDVSAARGPDPMQEGVTVQVPFDPAQPLDEAPADAVRCRFASEETASNLFVTPLLADRPVVARPESSFYLLGRHDVAMYVSHPVWVRLEAGDPPGELLTMPTHQPSDTWFGPSTREGEICYAVRTAARTSLDGFPFRPGRAVTELRIRNRAASPLAFERISIPAPHLSLYQDLDGRLWTEGVTVERPEHGDAVQVRVGGAPPDAAEKAILVSKPWQSESRNVLERAIGMLVG